MKCPNCNGEVFPGQFICDHCGKIIEKAEKPEKEKKNGK